MYAEASSVILGAKPITHALTAVLLVWLFYSLCLAVYRVHWHPYARYPGPILGKLTSWWASYLAYKGEIHVRMKLYHDTYGNIVRLGPNKIVFNTNTALTTIYRSREVRKAEAYRTWVANDGTWHVINAIDKRIHARKNKHMRQVMHPDKLKQYEGLWLGLIDQFIEGLAGDKCLEGDLGWSDPRNVRVHSDRMMIDIMGKIGFGRDMNCQTQKHFDYLPAVVAGTAKWNSVNVQSTSLAKLHLGEILYPQQLLYKRQSWQQVKQYLHDCRVKGSTPTSMFAHMIDLQLKDHGDNPPLNELWVDATVLISGLSDQVGSAVSMIIFYLGQNPRVCKRLTEEIRATFVDTADIRSGPAMESCQYLHAVIKEALRMSPTTGGALWREVISEGFRIDDEVIPRGLDVGVGIYSIHHNEDYFPDSYSFIPERWLGEHHATDLSLAETAWNPFSVGPRSCVAQTMVFMELKDILSKLLWALDLRPTMDEKLGQVGGGIPGRGGGRHRPNEFQMKDHITGQYDGPYIEFKRRC